MRRRQTAVSYTHLDVYKRQHVESGAHLRARAGQSNVAFYMWRGFGREVTLDIQLFLGFHHLRQTKVENLYFAADGDKDVLRLDVAMNKMCIRDRVPVHASESDDAAGHLYHSVSNTIKSGNCGLSRVTSSYETKSPV